MYYQMLHFSDLQRKPISGQFFAFSEAYIYSAEVLCANLCKKNEDITYAHGAAVMSLAYHGCELFLKAAILCKVPKEQLSGINGHNLECLNNRCAELFPEEEWTLDIPFGIHLSEESGLDSQIDEELKNLIRVNQNVVPQDQLQRYPSNGKCETWKSNLGFEPNSFLVEIAKIKSKFEKLKLSCQK